MNYDSLGEFKSPLSLKNKVYRLIWYLIWLVLARPFPRRIGNRWKIFLLRTFGARIHGTAVIYSSATVYMPWKLEMHEYSCLAENVDCYNVDYVSIGAYSTVSQKAYLCTASHDISRSDHPLITAPIAIKDRVWIGADAFIGMGVTIYEGAVVGARAAVFKDVQKWTVVGGNPAQELKKRILKND